jgi:hypothetical protein
MHQCPFYTYVYILAKQKMNVQSKQTKKWKKRLAKSCHSFGVVRYYMGVQQQA